MKIYISKITFEPLFKAGDRFIIVERNKDENMTPFGAMKLSSKRIYGFYENELELL